MKAKAAYVLAAFLGAVFATVIQQGVVAFAAEPEEVPPPPEEMASAPPAWESLEFKQTIPVGWGSVISINRVEEGGESYTFWFLGTDGTLRGLTTREFTGPNRATFFPEVYVIRRQ